MFTHVFEEDATLVINKIFNGDNFALSRYADGEYHVMNALQCNGCDGWEVGPEDGILAEALTKAFTHTEGNYFYGISCPCCDSPKYTWLKENIKQEWGRITYSNLFVNGNYSKFKSMVESLERPVVLLVNEAADEVKYPFDVVDRLLVPGDVIKWYRDSSQEVEEAVISLAKKYTDTLFFVSAGPLSELSISLMYQANPNNSYIDVGSSLDYWTHQRYTRLYQNPTSEFSTRMCSF